MLEISNAKVYDLEESVIACRNAMRLEPPTYSEEEFNNSLGRAIVEANTPNGSGHQTFLSGIRVSFDIVYPNYISPELQRYHWIDIVTSSSKMHKITKMDFSKCCNKYVTKNTINEIEMLKDEYNAISMGKLEHYIFYGCEEPIEVFGYKECLYFAFMRLISNCPQGVELFMRVSTNYLQLKTIYHQRKHHKLKEDWGAFCSFVESLPYAKEFIIGE